MYLLEVSGLTVAYSRGLGGFADIVAARNVGFSLAHGEIMGLIGESGSGKSTVLGAIAGLIKPESGKIVYKGKAVTALPKREFAMLFQSVALDPKMRIFESIAEPIRNTKRPSREEETRRIHELLELVKLPASFSSKYPHELSGGELQRVAIARALTMKPSLLLADEPVSALDVSVRGHVLDVLRNLCGELGIACILVTHDLGVAKNLCDSICVMNRGTITERGDRSKIFNSPENIYTKLLLASILPVVPEHGEQARRQRALLWSQYKREGGDRSDAQYDLAPAGVMRSPDFVT